MNCDRTRLQAFVHDGLNAGERAAVREHLSGCPSCRDEERRLREQDRAVEGVLLALGPTPSELPSTAGAGERFRSTLRRRTPQEVDLGRADRSGYSSGVTFKARIEMYASRLTHRRPVLVAAVVAVCLATVIGFAPARQLVSKFLSIFRVRQFSAVSIDREHLQKLHDLGENLRAGMPAEPEYERKPGEPRKVSDTAEASRLAGFAVKSPAPLPAGAEVTDFSVCQGPIMTYPFDREKIIGQLEAAGLSGITLPPMESGTIRVEIPALAHLAYRIPQPSGKDTTVVEVIQVANPSVTLPPGADVQAWGELMLQILGMPPDKAKSLAQSIDWTSTLVVPLPAEMASFQEVEVNGVKGLLVEQRPGAEGREEDGSGEGDSPDQGAAEGRSGEHRPHEGRLHAGSALLWQKDDTVYCVRGEHILAAGLLQIAESLR
jgi:hypothetical protein